MARHRRSSRFGHRAAFTLLELLLVMGLLGLLLGAGVGMLASLNLGERAALGLVQNVVRSARNSAVARGAAARVRIDPANSKLSAEALEVVGTWHFEGGGDTVRGAFDLDGARRGAVYVDDGFLGAALAFPRGERAWAEIPVQLDPSFDLEQGFRIDCAVRISENGGGRVLRVGESIGIDVTDGGAIKAWLVPKVKDSTGRDVKGGRLVSATPPGTLPPEVWRRVAIEYDRRRFVVSVDGVASVPADGWLEADAPVWTIDAPLYFGDVQQSFTGSLDSVTIAALATGEVTELPGNVRFDPAVPTELSFDAGGNLDRERHQQPQQIRLIYEDGRSSTVRVGLYGTVE